MSAVELIDVNKSYHSRGRETPVLHSVSFALPEGGALGLIGESGAGKSTIAKVVLGLEPVSSGTVLLDGAPAVPPRGKRERLAQAKRVQIVFQDPYLSLNPRLPVGAAIERTLVLHGRARGDARTRAIELLDQVGLGEREGGARPSGLSGGQRQRAAIARALAVAPHTLILDEAVAALDVSVQAQVLNLLNELRAAEGLSYLFITHNLAVVQYITDTAVVLRDGRVEEAGPTREVLAAPRSEYARHLLQAVPRGIPTTHTQEGSPS